MAEILTFGYTGTTPEAILAWAKRVDAIVVDCRFSPVSRHPRWAKKNLHALFDGWYVHLQGFGNVNYKSGGVKLFNPDEAYEVLRRQFIPTFKSIALMCACEDVLHCHRRDVAYWLAEKTGWSITHVAKAEVMRSAVVGSAPGVNAPELTPRQAAALQRKDAAENQLGLGIDVPHQTRRFRDES